MLQFCSFSSGSSGNCYLVKSEKTALLVDAGIPLKRIREGLALTATPEESVEAVLITHEHSDHIRSIGAICGSRGLKHFVFQNEERTEWTVEPPRIYANAETWNEMDRIAPDAYYGIPERECCAFREPFDIGDITVRPFHLSHDAAAAMGYSFTAGGSKITIVTDTGIVTDEIREETRNADLLVLEANHDVEMLRIGRYPWFLKQRILGAYGHLSNDTAAELVCDLLREGTAPKTVALAHLSKENNFPEMAYQTLKNAVEEAGYTLGKDIEARTLVRDTVSELFTV